MLNTICHGSPGDKPPLVIVHGLFGSARNWGVIAKRLSNDRRVIAVDLPNHGESAWSAPHDYPAMAAALAELLESFDGPVDLLGHSMGGKAAMMLALTRGELVHKLVVADIAPVPYSHTQEPFIEAMKAVDLSRVTRRSEAELQLAEHGVERALQSFFTQSLDIANGRWRLNLDQLQADMDKIIGFPQIERAWTGPTLFLSGGESDYVRPEHRATIRALFPKARFMKIPGAGHWLHAEKPREFEATVRAWVDLSEDQAS
ncbi:alpha/beta fold hydrolase [Lutimaribacter marinistellae]|uniref:Alpha/beta fold hydrolase n=1 Tax=Lutimaribacter marinistellae TaxID=1820329 RepID=A0ABV7TJC3_9RHOB